jgi:hypothetical protein
MRRLHPLQFRCLRRVVARRLLLQDEDRPAPACRRREVAAHVRAKLRRLQLLPLVAALVQLARQARAQQVCLRALERRRCVQP